jgi:hypothetical protein
MTDYSTEASTVESKESSCDRYYYGIIARTTNFTLSEHSKVVSAIFQRAF